MDGMNTGAAPQGDPMAALANLSAEELGQLKVELQSMLAQLEQMEMAGGKGALEEGMEEGMPEMALEEGIEGEEMPLDDTESEPLEAPSPISSMMGGAKRKRQPGAYA